MSRSWKLFLRDIVDSADKVARFTANMNLGTFVNVTFTAKFRLAQGARTRKDAILRALL